MNKHLQTLNICMNKYLQVFNIGVVIYKIQIKSQEVEGISPYLTTTWSLILSPLRLHTSSRLLSFVPLLFFAPAVHPSKNSNLVIVHDYIRLHTHIHTLHNEVIYSNDGFIRNTQCHPIHANSWNGSEDADVAFAFSIC